MSIITSLGGTHIGKFYDFPYWAVKLRDPEQWVSEVDNKQFQLLAYVPFMDRRYKNTFDWTIDLVKNDDILRIEQLWMFCPKNEVSPQGNTAMFMFSKQQAGTAFMFHVTQMQQESRIDHLIIGKVDNRATGACTCFIWDDQLRVMSTPYITNVNNFEAWREGIAPIGQLMHDIIGLRL